MPWYATAYVLVLIALAGANWQFGVRLGVPSHLRIGDALSALASIALTIAFWHERWRLALGALALPLFLAWVAWLVYAIKPATAIALHHIETRPDASEGGSHAAAVFSIVLSLLVLAPGLFWGFRVARVQLGF